jgi:hypothetical protein
MLRGRSDVAPATQNQLFVVAVVSAWAHRHRQSGRFRPDRVGYGSAALALVRTSQGTDRSQYVALALLEKPAKQQLRASS